MRTPEQIENLRKVFCGLYGPIVFFYPADAINALADRLQDECEWVWEIRVRTEANLETDWSNIKPEPTSPLCTKIAIQSNCRKLLKKYPSILSILVVAKENQKMFFEIDSQ